MNRYVYVSTTVRGGRRAAQQEAARLVKEGADGRIPLEHRRMAIAISEEPGSKELRRIRGRDLDASPMSCEKRSDLTRRGHRRNLVCKHLRALTVAGGAEHGVEPRPHAGAGHVTGHQFLSGTGPSEESRVDEVVRTLRDGERRKTRCQDTEHGPGASVVNHCGAVRKYQSLIDELR